MLSPFAMGFARATSWGQAISAVTPERFLKVVVQPKDITETLLLKNAVQMSGKGDYAHDFTSSIVLDPESANIISIKPQKSALPVVYTGFINDGEARGYASRSLSYLQSSFHSISELLKETDYRNVDAVLPDWLRKLGALDEQGKITPLGQAVINSVDVGPSDDPSEADKVRELVERLVPPLVEAGMSNKEGAAMNMENMLQNCEIFALEHKQIPHLKQEAEAILLKQKEAYDYLNMQIKGRDPSDKQIRFFYNFISVGLSNSITMTSKKALTSTDLHLTVREKFDILKVAFYFRSLTRHFTRQLGNPTTMARLIARDYLKSINSPRPSSHGKWFHERINSELNRPPGQTTFDGIIDDLEKSARHTNSNINERLNHA